MDIPDDLYRQVKAKSALEGRPVREVAIELFHHWVEGARAGNAVIAHPKADAKVAYPTWFGALRKYAGNARGRHDMDSVRMSVARARGGKPRK